MQVEVERVVYLPDLQAPPEKPHPFAYFISISNHSQETVVIRGRKWILRDDQNEVLVVEGRGVVGEMPELKAGEQFRYNSYHVIARNSKVTGAFFGVDEGGGTIRVGIPEFHLEIPIRE